MAVLLSWPTTGPPLFALSSINRKRIKSRGVVSRGRGRKGLRPDLIDMRKRLIKLAAREDHRSLFPGRVSSFVSFRFVSFFFGSTPPAVARDSVAERSPFELKEQIKLIEIQLYLIVMDINEINIREFH